MDAALRTRTVGAPDEEPTICIRTVVTGGDELIEGAESDAATGPDRSAATAYEVMVGGGGGGVRRVQAPGPDTRTDEPDTRTDTGPGPGPGPGTGSDAGSDGSAADRTVTFITDRATAVAIASGRESAQSAFMAGRLRVDGDTRLLMSHQGLIGDLDDLFGEVRAVTDFETAGAS